MFSSFELTMKKSFNPILYSFLNVLNIIIPNIKYENTEDIAAPIIPIKGIVITLSTKFMSTDKAKV